MATLSRRAFLLISSLLASVAPVRGHAQPPPASVSGAAGISVEEFQRLSQRLVGRTTLDAQAATTYLNALVAVSANVPLLAELARSSTANPSLTPAHVALERTIIEWWYTGVYVAGGEARVMTHTGALKWSALGMPAPGTCAGPFGAWAHPPRARA